MLEERGDVLMTRRISFTPSPSQKMGCSPSKHHRDVLSAIPADERGEIRAVFLSIATSSDPDAEADLQRLKVGFARDFRYRQTKYHALELMANRQSMRLYRNVSFGLSPRSSRLLRRSSKLEKAKDVSVLSLMKLHFLSPHIVSREAVLRTRMPSSRSIEIRPPTLGPLRTISYRIFPRWR